MDTDQPQNASGQLDEAFEVVVSELPARDAQRTAPSWLYRLVRRLLSPQTRAWRLIATGALLVLVLEALLGNLPLARSIALSLLTKPIPTPATAAVPTALPTATPFPSPTPYPTPTELGSLVPGPLPSGCPATPLQIRTLAPNFRATGSGPVWVVGMKSTFHLAALGEKPDPRYGWFWTLMWEVGPSYEQPVIVHGLNLRTGAPLWFNLNPEAPNTVTMVLDPHQPGHPVSDVGEDWHEWGSYMYIPVAGCYDIEADWPGGQWQIIFAAGA